MGYTIYVLVFAIINYFAAYVLRSSNRGFDVNPALYALGSIIFGGSVPLFFLMIKFFWYLYKKNKYRY